MEWTSAQIKALREHLEWTQTQLGEELGYGAPKARVSELERDVRRASGPVRRLLDRLAEEHDFK